jgi:hypothetical protein
MYEEYDYSNEPSSGSLKESLYDILRGLKDPQKLREAETSLKSALQLTPNVIESLARGGVGQAIGTSGDLRELRNTVNSYLPKSVQNFTQAAEFLANPYATAIQQTAPTTEKVLETVPRATAPYEGYKQHETLGEFVAPALGYFGVKGLKAMKDLPIGASIEDVSKAVPNVEVKGIPQSEIDALGFHSPLENAILKIQQPKGTGDQFLKQLEKTPGVKTEELEVTGLKQYLLDHPTVTKQELLDQMSTSRLKLEQKVLGEATGEGNTFNDYELRGGDVFDDDEYIRGLADDLHYDMKNDDVIRSQEREALLEADPERYADYKTNSYAEARLEEDIDGSLYEQAKSQANDMYYENPIRHYYDEHGYDVYGNDEMGYSIKDPRGNFVTNLGEHYDYSDVQAALRDHLLDEGVLNMDEAGAAKFENYTLPGNYTNYREVLTTHNPTPAIVKELDNGYFLAKEKPGQTGGLGKTRQEAIDRFHELDEVRKFESNHYDEPNILAHTRLNDRIINGKKTLMVEEIQSDWHQTGRKKGYETPEVRENIAKERQKLLDQKDHFAELAKPYTDLGKDAPPEIVEGWTLAANGLQELQQVENGMRNSVPNAPFKKNWHELMMKQILNEAVKGDYEAVAFTTGKQQAERYSLSKQISSIKYTDDGQLRAYGKNGEQVISRKLNSSDELEDYIGKEAAKKLMEQEPKMVSMKGDIGTVNDTGRELSGVDLDVGGEGMKGFYDKILPDFINKYGKKYGIGVKKANLKGKPGASQEEVNAALKEFGVTKEEFDKLPIDKRVEILDAAQPKGDEVHYFDLTDMAKKDIKEKGQPLFSGIGLAAPALMPEDQDKTKK